MVINSGKLRKGEKERVNPLSLAFCHYTVLGSGSVVRAQAGGLPEDPDFKSSTHMVVFIICNSSSRRSDVLASVATGYKCTQTHMQGKHSYS